MELLLNDKPSHSPLDDYFRLMRIQGHERVFHIARECGLIQALRDTPMPQTATQFAERLGFASRPVELMLKVLSELGIAVASPNGFAPGAVLALLQGDYADLGGRYWKHLPDYLKTARPLFAFDGSHRPEELEAFYVGQAMSLYAMMKASAELFARRTLAARRIDHPFRILDIGAGSSVWSLPFARASEQVQVTAQDLAPVLKVAEGLAVQWGVRERYTYCPAPLSALPENLGTFDLILVANVMHLLDASRNSALFKRLQSHLSADGELALIDVFAGQDEGRFNVALYELGLALRVPGSRVYAPSEARELLQQSGYVAGDCEFLDVAPFTMGVIRAKRSQPTGGTR